MLDFVLDVRRGNFHLEVECRLASEWTVIYGPSGAGKSTLQRLLAGLDRPDHGHITLDGNTLTDTADGVFLRPGHRWTTLVAQQPALFPHLSSAANVAYGLSRMNRDNRHSRVDEMLELVDARSLADRRPAVLSGGEAQRIALARSLAPLPRLLLLDEPFSALDGTASDALMARLQLWTREHRVQTILVTHDATDAFATESEVALMREGRLIALGPAEQALASERERIVARLRSF
jgi:ABC-type sulfate/molybdate transport systems ATPase subunit